MCGRSEPHLLSGRPTPAVTLASDSADAPSIHHTATCLPFIYIRGSCKLAQLILTLRGCFWGACIAALPSTWHLWEVIPMCSLQLQLASTLDANPHRWGSVLQPCLRSFDISVLLGPVITFGCFFKVLVEPPAYVLFALERWFEMRILVCIVFFLAT